MRTYEALPHEWGRHAAQPWHRLQRPHPWRSICEPGDSHCRCSGEHSRSGQGRPARATIFSLRGFWGKNLLEARDWHKAGLACASARDTFLLLFGEGINDAEARDLIAEAGYMFAQAAFAAAQRGATLRPRSRLPAREGAI